MSLEGARGPKVGGLSRRTRAARLGLAATVAACLAALPACASPPGVPAVAPRVLPPPTRVRSLTVAPSWTASLETVLSVSMAPDASAVAGSSSAGGGGTAWAFSAAGRAIALPGAAGSDVIALSRGVVVVGPGLSDAPGPISVFDSAGLLLRQAGSGGATPVGPIDATSNLAGSRFAILDEGAAKAVELRWTAGGRLQPQSVPGLGPLGASASISFDDAGDALVVDAEHAALYSAADRLLWSVSLQPNALPHSLVFDRDGRGVTAATAGTDNRLYQFVVNAGGRAAVAWSQPLAAGGSHDLVAGPGGLVAVLGAGADSTFGVYRERDGGLQWQDTVPAAAGAPTPAVQALAFAPGGGVVAAVRDCDARGASCLLLLDAQGRELARIPLNPGARAFLARNGMAAAVLQAPRAGSPGAVLAWLDLAGAWRAVAGAPSSAAAG